MIRLSAIFLAVCLTAPLPCVVMAGGEHDHGKDHKPGSDAQHHAPAAFANVKEAWQFLTDKLPIVEASVAGNKLEPIHELSEQMQGAVMSLAGGMDAVPEATRSKLESALKQLKKSTDELHHGAEDNDAAKASAAVMKLKGLLPLIEGLYPAGVLK